MSIALFYYNILNNPERALYLLHHVWTDGSAEVDTVTEEKWKDSMTMLYRVRFNLTLCASDMQGDNTEDVVDDTDFDE
ncbi:tyrosine 3-monooxygenase [Gymnopilus junonius]|uniref:Tyrosine 3-monooxygenase n=1 Tax=Gymnopilus junonius TaxID=109634 RepID=A0A9P5ND93_GYMJU|nr:tyrosine 3-monooxygenase [Gymnopilus junonius]